MCEVVSVTKTKQNQRTPDQGKGQGTTLEKLMNLFIYKCVIFKVFIAEKLNIYKVNKIT